MLWLEIGDKKLPETAIQIAPDSSHSELVNSQDRGVLPRIKE
ncbi:hypothetical protein [Moorena producens]